jgi:hypothetical protein
VHSESNHHSGTPIFLAVCDETWGCDSDFKNPNKCIDSLLIFSRLPTDTKELKTCANAPGYIDESQVSGNGFALVAHVPESRIPKQDKDKLNSANVTLLKVFRPSDIVFLNVHQIEER